MQKSLKLVFLLCMMCSSSIALSSAHAGNTVLRGNLLPNNGFESVDQSRGLPSEWVVVSSRKDCSVGMAGDRSFAGRMSVVQKHSRGGLPGSYVTAKTPTRVLPNRNYRFSGWVMTSPDGRSDWTSVPSARGQRVEGCCLQLIFKGKNGVAVGEVWSPTVQTGGKWERLEINIKAPDDAHCAETRLYHGDFKGNSWFDSVRLEAVDDADNSVPGWKLHRDVYALGKLPPTFEIFKSKGQLSVQLSESGSDEYTITMKPADNVKLAGGSLRLPAIDTSFLGNFRISGEYRLRGHSAGTAAGVSVSSCDMYGSVLSEKAVALGSTSQWRKFSLAFTAEGESEHLSTKINVAGRGYVLELRGLTAQRLSRVSLEEYAGISRDTKWKAAWIWYPEDPETNGLDTKRYFTKAFTVDGDVKKAELRAAADNSYAAYLNGRPIGEGTKWDAPNLFDVTKSIVRGRNVVAVRAVNAGGPAGFIMELKIEMSDGRLMYVGTDGKVLSAKSVENGWMNQGHNHGKEQWKSARVIGVPPVQPWGRLAYVDGTVSDTAAGAQLVSDNNPTQLPDVRICRNNGVPTLMVNGQVTGFDQYCNTYRPFDSVIKNCEKAGLIQELSLLDIDWEKGPDGVNLAELDHQVHQVLKNAPNANIIICPDSSGELSPKSWSHYNPSELYVNNLGETRIRSYGGEMKTYPSMASQKWQQDMDALLTRVVGHVQKSDYANRVIGYWLSGYEWFQWEWAYNDRMDYSVHMRDAFRKWLRSKYGTVEELRKAWNDESTHFDTLEIPSTEQRRKTADGMFRDPATSQNVIDFCKFYSDLVADVLIRQGKTVKTASGKNTLTCAMYGYTTVMFDGISRETSGHFGVRKAIQSGYLDFTISPSDGYAFERGIGGTGGYTTAPGSNTLHNSIFANQADFRTHWSLQDIERTNTVRDDINLFRREFAMNLTNLAASQWYDFSTGWQLGDTRITRELARLKKVTRFAQSIDRTPYNEGMAVIISEDVNSYIGTDKFLFDGGLTYNQRFLFFRSGMPHRTYLMSDLADPDMPDHKFFLFVNAFKLTDNEKAMIRSKCMKSGNVVMFVYAPGYIDRHSLSVDNMTRFLGIKLAKMDGPVDAHVCISPDAGIDWLRSSSGIVYGQSVWSPMFCVDDSTAHTLGKYVGRNKVGLAYKDFGNYKVVYSGAPLLPPDLLRGIGRLAGCHIYLDTSDALYADKDFVAVHTKSAGVKKIKLPAKTDVYDLINHRVIARDTDSFRVTLDGGETGLFYVGKANNEWFKQIDMTCKRVGK